MTGIWLNGAWYPEGETPPPDPAAEILAVLAEPLGLPWDEVVRLVPDEPRPGADDPAGRCEHGPDGQCPGCYSPPDAPLRLAARLFLLGAGLVLLSAAPHLWWPLGLPGCVLLFLAVLWGRS